MDQRRCLTVERTLGGSNESLESEADWASRGQMGLIQRRFLFAADAVIEARLPIEGRIGSHLVRYLVGRGGWSEEGMGRNGILCHHEVVADLGRIEEEESPLRRARSSPHWRCKGGDVLALPCTHTLHANKNKNLAEVNRYTLDLKES